MNDVNQTQETTVAGGVVSEKATRKYSSKLYTKEQAEWCRQYQGATTFEPLMDDFEAGNETFYEAAQKSARWFEDWSSDALLSVTRNIPGWEQKYGGYP